MFYPSQPTITVTDVSRLFGSLLMAGAITFSLFVIMDRLTRMEGASSVDPTPLPIIDPVYIAEHEKTILKPTLRPKPELKIPPKLETKIVPTDPDNANPAIQVAMTIPQTKFSTGIENGLGLTGGDARPIVRMEPKYPIEAARDGIEGWVKLIFNIDASGQVKDIQVIDSQPKRTFDRAAKRALAKWKYKPQIVDGKPLEQAGMQVMLSFNLDNS